MTHDPRTTSEVYEDLKDSLSDRVTQLSNFTEQSFNALWNRAFASEIRKLELKTTAAEMAGWIDYTGGRITQSDLDELGIDDSVSPSEISQYMDRDYLDEYVKIVGVERLPGSRSTGAVDITTQSDPTTIPSGTVVTTEPDENGVSRNFQTTEDASTGSGVTVVQDVPIQAQNVGPEYNVPAGTIVRFLSPPTGVSGVTNNSSTTGGENEESNQELRQRAKNAVESASLGGTTAGMKAYIRQNIEGVGEGDIIIDELPNQDDVDVIVDGGLDSDVNDAIDFSRPIGVQHNLVRPEIFELGFSVYLAGTDINTSRINDTIEDFLLDGGIGENFYERELIRQIMNTDEDVINVSDIGGTIERVTNEIFTYDSSQSEYRLEYTYEKNHGSIEITAEDGSTFTKNTDYTVEDQTGDGWPETIVWQGNSEPNDGDDFFVDYDVTVPSETVESDEYATDLVRDEILTYDLNRSEQFEYNNADDNYELNGIPFNATVSIQDENSTSYTKNTDYQLVPLGDDATEDTITYSTTTSEYDLSEEVVVDDIAVIDGNGNIYEEGVDYQITDTDSDGTEDTIDWSIGGSNPSDSVSFTVNYNDYAKNIRWDKNASTPAQGDSFTVSYDQSGYLTEYEIVETPNGEIDDASGDTYIEGTDYKLATDRSRNAVIWTTDPASLNDDEEFYVTYHTKGNIFLGNRKKYDPGQITVTQE